DLADPSLLDTLRALHQAQRILGAVPDGVAVVDSNLRVRWANPPFDSWCGGPSVGRGFYEALGAGPESGPDYCPFHTALAGLSAQRPPAEGQAPTVGTRLECR